MFQLFTNISRFSASFFHPWNIPFAYSLERADHDKTIILQMTSFEQVSVHVRRNYLNTVTQQELQFNFPEILTIRSQKAHLIIKKNQYAFMSNFRNKKLQGYDSTVTQPLNQKISKYKYIDEYLIQNLFKINSFACYKLRSREESRIQ